jgi:sterol 3beta-glucosyltransferase
MKAILTNFGTVGEVYPLLALAQEFEGSGHEALLALSPDYEEWTLRLGLKFVSIGPPAKAILNQLTLAAALDPQVFESVAAVRNLLGPMKEQIPHAFAQLRDACQDADVIISGQLQPAAKMVHETEGIPYVSLFAGPIAPGKTSASYQRATQWLVNPYRAELGLPPVPDPFAGDSVSDQLALYAISSHVLSPPASWPAHYHLVGYFQLQEDRWEPEPELMEFLASGPPPVVVAFGSVVHDNPKELTELIIRAAQLANCRIIFQHGWSGLARHQLPDGMYAVDYVPHQWLFSRASCVVHHGGSGTSAAVFRAGVPAIFVPHILDQPFWASLAQKLGVACHAVPPSQLTAEKLSEAIHNTLNAPNCRDAARELGEKIRAEKGTEKARVLIERMHARQLSAHRA